MQAAETRAATGLYKLSWEVCIEPRTTLAQQPEDLGSLLTLWGPQPTADLCKPREIRAEPKEHRKFLGRVEEAVGQGLEPETAQLPSVHARTNQLREGCYFPVHKIEPSM